MTSSPGWSLDSEVLAELALQVAPSLDTLHDSDGLAKLSSKAEDIALSSRLLHGVSLRRRVFERRQGDLYSREGLDLLRNELLDAVQKRIERSSSEYEDALTGVVGLAALHSARFDWHLDGAERVRSWMTLRFGNGYGDEEDVALCVAKASVEFGAAAVELSARPSAQPSLPPIGRLEALASKLQRLSSESSLDDAGKPWPRLVLWLIESISAMPATWLAADDRGAAYREFALQLSAFGEPGGSEGTPLQMWDNRPQLRARAAYVAAEMQYAADNLSEAQRLLRCALNMTDGSDLTFVERCQTRLMFFDQEQASRSSNQQQITSLVDEQAQERFEEFKTDARHEMQGIAHEGVRESTLRVVEILGLFVAVAGIVGTSLGGAFAAETWLAALVVYGSGLVGIAILLGAMLWVVNRGRQRHTVAASNDSGSETRLLFGRGRSRPADTTDQRR